MTSFLQIDVIVHTTSSRFNYKYIWRRGDVRRELKFILGFLHQTKHCGIDINEKDHILANLDNID